MKYLLSKTYKFGESITFLLRSLKTLSVTWIPDLFGIRIMTDLFFCGGGTGQDYTRHTSLSYVPTYGEWFSFPSAGDEWETLSLNGHSCSLNMFLHIPETNKILSTSSLNSPSFQGDPTICGVTFHCVSVLHSIPNISFQRSRIRLDPNSDTVCPTFVTT